MNKTELVAAIAEKAELSKKDSEKALKAFVDVVAEELKKGEKIQLVGFGTFEVSERAERKVGTGAAALRGEFARGRSGNRGDAAAAFVQDRRSDHSPGG